MVTIRLARGGAKKRPFYHVNVTDSRNARDVVTSSVWVSSTPLLKVMPSVCVLILIACSTGFPRVHSCLIV